MNDCHDGSVRKDGRSARMREMNVGAVSREERAYLLGLYFADGWIGMHGKTSQQLAVGLQVNEREIAEGTAEMLKRAGLNPHVYHPPSKNMILVYAVGVNLTSFFGEKEGVRSLEDSPVLRWMVANRLEVPFIAGLVDGDGSATAKLLSREGCFFGKIQVQAAFSQIAFPFLVDFVHEYVNKLVSRGASLLDDSDEWRLKTGRRVSILARGREALIRSGILDWSFKFKRLMSEVEHLKAGVAELKSRYLTLRQLAQRLGVGNSTVWRWCKEGKIRHVYVRSSHAKRRAAHLLIPIEEVRQFERSFSKEGKGAPLR